MELEIEMNREELQELCEHYEQDMPEIIEEDALSCKIECDEHLKHYLLRDNIACYDKAGRVE